jgi:hypothetical protein
MPLAELKGNLEVAVSGAGHRVDDVGRFAALDAVPRTDLSLDVKAVPRATLPGEGDLTGRALRGARGFGRSEHPPERKSDQDRACRDEQPGVGHAHPTIGTNDANDTVPSAG